MNNWILVLYEIGRRMKSKNDKIFISSSELGTSLGISQQTASRYLQNLEKRNLISRKTSNEGQEIRLTSEGFDLLYETYANLKEFFEGKKDIPVFEGDIISGLGEGAYYIKEYEDRIKEILGFKPFLGTLNIRLKEPQNLERYSTGVITGFKRGGRTFGEVKFMPVRITFNSRPLVSKLRGKASDNSTAKPCGGEAKLLRHMSEQSSATSKLRGQSPRIKDKSANCYLILPKRRHYKDTVEIISKLNLRKTLGIKKGDKVRAELIV